ncbi:MAG: DUF7261 family protein [archaeon]
MGRSRGQVILVAALGIAVTLVALALITNTAIYTENLATRDTVNGQTAVAFQQSVESGASGLLALANRYNATDHSTIQSQFDSDVAALRNGTESSSARYGDLESVSVVNATNGSRIAQNASRNFTDASGAENWTLATDVEQTRRFQMNVSTSELSATDPFTVTVSNGSAQWTAEIAQDDADTANVTVDDGDNTTSCTVDTSDTGSVVVDLTEGTAGGDDCDTPLFASSVSGQYDISFDNSTNVTGRYVLFVDRTPDAIEADLADDPYVAPADDGPTLQPALYDATLHVSVRQPELRYETNVTVAPTKSPEGEVYGVVP